MILSGAIEIEHHEIAVYETLIALGEGLGQREVVAALRGTLEQEQRQLSRVSDSFQKSLEDLEMEGAAEDGLVHKVKSKLPQMIESPRELLEFELGAALKMEKAIVGMLGHLQEQSQGGQLKRQLHDHAAETHGHIQNLERAFAAVGVQPQERPCRAIEAIEKESTTNLKITRARHVGRRVPSGSWRGVRVPAALGAGSARHRLMPTTKPCLAGDAVTIRTGGTRTRGFKVQG